MSTRKIIDAKHNGEKVWIKGHAQAIYMSDGSTVEDAINNIDISSLDEYVTETELNDKGFLTEHQDISHLATTDEIPTKVSDLENDSNFLEGESTGYYSDDFSESDGISIMTAELYYDDGSGEVVPIKHPDLSTQPSILPYKLAGNYVYEQLLAIPDNITIDNTTGYIKFDIEAPKWEIEKPSILKAVIISSNDGINAQLNLPCVVVNRGTKLSIAVSDTLFSLVELKNLWMLIEYTSFEGLRGYYYNAENGVEDNKDTSKYNLYINVEDGYTWEINGKQYNTGLHKLSDEEVTYIITTSGIFGGITSTLDDTYGYMKVTLEGYTETRNASVPWSKSNVTGLWSFGLVYFYETYHGVYSLEYHLPLAAEAIKNGEKVILELTDSY